MLILIEIGFEELPALQLDKFTIVVSNYIQKYKNDFIKLNNYKIFLTSTRLCILILYKKKIHYNFVGKILNNIDIEKKFKEKFALTKKNSAIFLKIILNEKNLEIHYLVKKENNFSTNNFLKNFLLNIIKLFTKFYVDSKMYWSAKFKQFIRPIKFINLLIGKNKLYYNFFGIISNVILYGNKYIQQYNLQKKNLIKTIRCYESTLEKLNIIPCLFKRIELVRKKINIYLNTKKINKQILSSNTILENCGLEYPFVYCGYFIKNIDNICCIFFLLTFKTKTKNIIIKITEKKFFFFFTTNIIKILDNKVKINYTRLLFMHLAEIQNFLKKDCKIFLLYTIKKLKKIIFLKKLGNLFEKIKRLIFIANNLCYSCITEKKKKYLLFLIAKIDLIFAITAEYPQLKGYVGAYYSLYNGISVEISFALLEQYNFTYYKSNIPKSTYGILLSLTDNIDDIISFLSIKKIQGKKGDLFSLKKCVQKIIYIIIKNKLKINLLKLIALTISSQEKFTTNIIHFLYYIFEFITKKILKILKEICLSFNFLEKTIEINRYKSFPYIIYKQTTGINVFIKIYNKLDILSTVKRLQKIIPVKKSKKQNIQHNLLLELGDMQLMYLLRLNFFNIYYLIKKNLYFQIFEMIATTCSFIEKFFTSILINHKNKVIKNNRLYLIQMCLEFIVILKNFKKL